jgi:hypothetical protein
VAASFLERQSSVRCLLRKGLSDGAESGASSASEEGVKRTLEQAAQRFEHYELVRGEDGKPVELGRGAMGVTYKAFDVDLHCPAIPNSEPRIKLAISARQIVGDKSRNQL